MGHTFDTTFPMTTTTHHPVQPRYDDIPAEPGSENAKWEASARWLARGSSLGVPEIFIEQAEAAADGTSPALRLRQARAAAEKAIPDNLLMELMLGQGMLDVSLLLDEDWSESLDQPRANADGIIRRILGTLAETATKSLSNTDPSSALPHGSDWFGWPTRSWGIRLSRRCPAKRDPPGGHRSPSSIPIPCGTTFGASVDPARLTASQAVGRVRAAFAEGQRIRYRVVSSPVLSGEVSDGRRTSPRPG